MAAGVHEGKNEITVRIGYFKVGINLKTETPTPARIKKSVEQVLSDPYYRINVQRLGAEFKQYDTNRLCEQYIAELLNQSTKPLAEKKSTALI
ncbi:hypothetical protein GCM10027592_60490 [Spirosoma flavus]